VKERGVQLGKVAITSDPGYGTTCYSHIHTSRTSGVRLASMAKVKEVSWCGKQAWVR